MDPNPEDLRPWRRAHLRSRLEAMTTTSTTSPASATFSASSSAPTGSIVVGIDGSAPSKRALAWAVRQAGLEHRTLTLVHAAHFNPGGDTGLIGLDVGALIEDLRQWGRDLLGDATENVAALDPDVRVHQVLTTDDPREALLSLAEQAAMLVIGSRGHGMVASLLLGSVSVSVSKQAACPVVVVRRPRSGDTAHSGGGVLVGVDGSAETQGAVEFAYRAASFRALPLTAVHVFWDTSYVGADQHDVRDDEPGLEDLRALVAESVAGMREKFPDVQDRVRLVRGFRDRQLIRASAGMDLLVVGARQRGFVGDFVYGTISPTVVEHAACDVAVVPAPPVRSDA